MLPGMNTPLERAIEHFGGINELAKRLDVDRTRVSHWRRSGFIPARHAIAIEVMTDGELLARDLVIRRAS